MEDERVISEIQESCGGQAPSQDRPVKRHPSILKSPRLPSYSRKVSFETADGEEAQDQTQSHSSANSLNSKFEAKKSEDRRNKFQSKRRSPSDFRSSPRLSPRRASRDIDEGEPLRKRESKRLRKQMDTKSEVLNRERTGFKDLLPEETKPRKSMKEEDSDYHPEATRRSGRSHSPRRSRSPSGSDYGRAYVLRRDWVKPEDVIVNFY